ncbi:MAG: alpha-2-macroglobulin [Bacteroidota bacterium]
MNRITPLLLLLAVMIVSCSRNTVDLLRVTSPLPTGVLSNTSVIALTFSRGVVPADSANQWTSTPYIEFTPTIPGKFVWQDSTTLVFSPDGPLPGDMKFTGRINTALLVRMSHAKSYDGNDQFTFSTESFTLKSAEFFYDRIGDKRLVGIKANLEFSYLVNPQDVLGHMKILIDNAPAQNPKVMTQEKNKVIALEVGTVTQREKEIVVSIDFDGSLISPETSTRIKLDKPYIYKLPPLGELAIYGHEVGFDGTTSWIKIRTSQEVDPNTVKPFITIDPVREYTVQSDNQAFSVKGKFEPGTAFHLVVKKGLESVLGGKTQNDYEADILIGDIKPSFRFTSASGVYMLLGGQKSLEVKTMNIPKLIVRVSQIFQNNLVFFLDGGRSYGYDYDYYNEEDEGTSIRKYRYSVGNYGRRLGDTTLTIKNLKNQEVTSTFNLDRFLQNGYKGYYLVEIADSSQPWKTTAKLISISDIGLIVKGSSDEVLVFATSLETNNPSSGVLVSLISTNNQVISSQKTNSDGLAKFSPMETLAKNFALKLITAELDNDFNFINLQDYRVETSRFEVDGKREAESEYDAYLYGDRNLYRPGEKVFVSGIIRNLTQELPARMPVHVKIFNPQGTVVKEIQCTLNDEGSFETNYQTLMTAETGDYRFEVYTGNGSFLGSYSVSVEDFVPDRLKVNLKASSETSRPGNKIIYDLLALNFFGPPAAGRNWEFEGTFDNIPYRSKNFPAYRFADDAATNYTAKPEVYNGTTDNEGKALIEFPLPKDLTSTGVLRVRGRVAVFDESGRPVYQIANTTVYPKDYYIGVVNEGDYYVSPNTAQKMDLIAVDQDDKPIKGFKAKIDLLRYEWHSVLRQHQGTNTLRYVSEKREIVAKSEIVTLSDTPLEYTYSVPRSGEYVIRVSKVNDTGYNEFSFYSYSWAGTSDITSYEINPEARVEMVFDKSIYAPGEKAKVLFQTPFGGKMLVTVERNLVFTYRYLDVVDNAASMEIPIEDEYLPNVYVSVVLFRKVKDQNIPLMAGHGFMPLMVEKKSNRLNVTINAPDKIRPKTKQKVSVGLGGEKDVFVTLAAVDEGICQVKNYRTPAPYEHFYAKKALETETYDFFKDLLPEPVKGKDRSSSGGGEEEKVAQRVNPLGVQRFKPLALWSGILRTNGNGEADVILDIPEFSGELRLMALAYKGDRFGSAQKGMKIADPIVITPALPRFLSPNDSIIMPITAFNTTEKPVKLTFDIETSGGIVPVTRSATLELKANQERYVNVTLKSTYQIGKGVVKVSTRAFGEKFESATELPIRPISPFVAEGITGIIDGGGSANHEVEDVYLPYGRKSHITLSPFPVANFAKELKYLVGYPHGCIEQTTSKAFPQIYLRDIAVLLDPSILKEGSPTYFVNEAITKITSMQMHDGTFSYWPGGDYTNQWTTVYATHFLLEAKKAGYAVSENTLKAALNAIAQIARSKATIDYYYYQNNKTVIKRIADKSALYALYVLALGGVPEKSLMDFYRTEKSLLTTDTRYLLAGAFALCGDRKTFNEVLPPEFLVEEAERTSGWNYDSPIRANALILNVLMDTDLNNENIPRYMEYLSKAYHGYYWCSTQDNAFTLLAFGKAARMATSTKLEGSISINGKNYSYKGGNQKFDIEPYGKKVTLSMKGQGRVYYSLVTEGIRKDGRIKIEDKNLQIRREFFDRNGSPVDLSAVKHNTLIVVRLTLNSNVDYLENVAITDLLPAGFEIENPRLVENTGYNFIKNATTPQYLDIRDDRINLYTSFKAGDRRHIFYYMVRAVTQGEFQYAPVVAEAMYNADYYSASGQTKLKIVK